MKHQCSMQKKKESLGRVNEGDWVRNVRERLWSLIDGGFITTDELGDYLMRALSEDTLQKVYGWLKQDEIIPNEDTLETEHKLKFDDKGNLVTVEEEET